VVESVYCAVRTDSLYVQSRLRFVFKRLIQLNTSREMLIFEVQWVYFRNITFLFFMFQT
jgi:hypothetical protein